MGPTRKLRILAKSNGNSRFLEGVLALLKRKLGALLESSESYKERKKNEKGGENERTTSFNYSNTLDAQERSADDGKRLDPLGPCDGRCLLH